VGFFGINEKPTSSSDPYALRRSALGLLRIIIEDKLTLSLRELLNTSKNSYFSQGVVFSNLKFTDDILDFLLERFRNLLKDQNIRAEIIEAVVDSKRVDNILSIYQKIK
ncbi:MAG: glycine--tRNA ligase subunit beta, partial [Candidatus Fonsibacter sp.]